MNRFARLLACALAGATGVVFLLGVLTPWLLGRSVFAGDLPGLTWVLLEESFRGEAMDTRDRHLVQCIEGKQQAVQDLLAGRATLGGTVERFRELIALLDDGQDELLGTPCVIADDQRLLRCVLDWVEETVQDDPRREEILARFESEARAYIAHVAPPAP